MKQYSVLPYMLKRWDKVGRKLALEAETLDEFEHWKKTATARLKELIGYDTMSKAAPEPEVFETKDCGDYTQYHMAIQSEPGVFVPMYVLKPKNGTGPFQPVIAAHGHVSCGKVSVAGVAKMPEISETIKEHNYDYGRQLCRAGFIVFCPDARGFGERREELAESDILGGSCSELNKMAIPLGQTVIGMWTWDLHRLIDYIESRDDCDVSKLCCVGLSGGGYQTILATALDERICCAVSSGYFYGARQSLLEMYNNCSCNYVPHLWEYLDICDIVALIAPRKFLIETGDEDELNGRDGLENVRSQLRVVAEAYKLHNKKDNLRHSIHKGGHKWYGTGTIEWLRCV